LSEDGHRVNSDLQEDRLPFLFYFILFYFILFYFILFYFILFYFILFCVVFNWSEVDGIICHTFSHLIRNFNIRG